MKVPIALSRSLYEWLRSSAFERRVPMAEIVREALTEHQERQLGQAAEGKQG